MAKKRQLKQNCSRGIMVEAPAQKCAFGNMIAKKVAANPAGLFPDGATESAELLMESDNLAVSYNALDGSHLNTEKNRKQLIKWDVSMKTMFDYIDYKAKGLASTIIAAGIKPSASETETGNVPGTPSFKKVYPTNNNTAIAIVLNRINKRKCIFIDIVLEGNAVINNGTAISMKIVVPGNCYSMRVNKLKIVCANIIPGIYLVYATAWNNTGIGGTSQPYRIVIPA